MESHHHREIAHEFLPFVRVYKDGTVERLIDPPTVPPTLDDPVTGVSSKDIVLNPATGVSARIYLPKISDPTEKLPILVYFHGGGFCVGSAFSAADHRYMTSVVSGARVLTVSVEYRLAPTHPLPTAYDDCFSALQWVAAHRPDGAGPDSGPESWILDHGDFDRVFIGGESAGGNIAHNVAMRAGLDGLPGGVRPVGVFLAMPYFWSSEAVGEEAEWDDRVSRVSTEIWEFVYPGCEGGVDGHHSNPFGPGAPSVAGIGCGRVLVVTAGKDELRERGKWYVEGLRKNGFQGEAELVEVEEENHVFHIFKPESEAAKDLLLKLASFIHK